MFFHVVTFTILTFSCASTDIQQGLRVCPASHKVGQDQSQSLPLRRSQGISRSTCAMKCLESKTTRKNKSGTSAQVAQGDCFRHKVEMAGGGFR